MQPRALRGRNVSLRLFRYIAVVVLLAIPVVVAGTPAAYSSTASASPSTVTPGEAVTFTVHCDQGLNAGGASAILDGSTLGLASQIPMNAINGSLFDFSISVTLPSSIQPGGYAPSISCPGGAAGATASLNVTAVPTGGAATGDGTTATATDSGLAIAGLAMIGTGALAGGVAVRRRRAAARRSG